jgi:soluble lytic murein transglycosylase-like protein
VAPVAAEQRMTDYRREILQASREHGLDPNLVEAVVVVESSGRTDAFRFEPNFWVKYLQNNPEYQGEIPRRVSSSYGLMQLMLPVARELGLKREPEYLFVPSVNLFFGCKKLGSLIQWAGGDIPKALEAYNGGKGSVGSQATQRYAAKVIREWDRIAEAG